MTMHAFGGVDMLRAGVEGLGAPSAPDSRSPPPWRSPSSRATRCAPAHSRPSGLASTPGRAAVVCAVEDARGARPRPAPHVVTPGIRPAGAPPTTRPARPPRRAFDAGADLLVIGRAVTARADPGGGGRPSTVAIAGT